MSTQNERTITIIFGSPMRPSRSGALAGEVGRRLETEGFRIRELVLRDLPAEALLHAHFDDPHVRAALSQVEASSGLIVASPVYKAAYSGLLKCFLDLLPQFALRGKTALPILTGASPVHALALDYALRPVLQSLDPLLVLGGIFALDKSIEIDEQGARLAEELKPRVAAVAETFVAALEHLQNA